VLDLDAEADRDFCYLTTTGRVSGRPHTIEIWFVVHEGCAYLMAGSARSDWVRNVRRDPATRLRLGATEVPATAQVVDDPADPRQPVVRAQMADKYGEREDDGSLTDWAQTAVVVEVCPERGTPGPR
jgi:deazaflavin-dependent oxidoreductase (nitroreductase family)